jgi:methylglutaconyl-CoA hydratase
MPANETVLSAVDSRGVATVTLNRPAVNNAYNGELIDGLLETIAGLERQDLRCVVLRGSGRHFQAGADLSFLQDLRRGSAEANLEFSRRTVAAIEALRQFPRPTVAVVHGGCFGGGVGIAGACDIAVAADDAVFALTEVHWGITPAPIIPLLVDRIGSRALGRLALTGERFGAAEALRIGLVHEICPARELATAAARIIENLLLAAPEAVMMTKRLIAESVETPFNPAFRDRITTEAAERRVLSEAAEGLLSFAEKRKPKWYPERAGGG